MQIPPKNNKLGDWKAVHHRRKKGETMSEASEGEFKGNPMLILKNSSEDKFPFQFGVKKAKLVLDHIEDIKKFVEKHGN